MHSGVCVHTHCPGIMTHTIHTAYTIAMPESSILGGNVWSVLVKETRICIRAPGTDTLSRANKKDITLRQTNENNIT